MPWFPPWSLKDIFAGYKIACWESFSFRSCVVPLVLPSLRFLRSPLPFNLWVSPPYRYTFSLPTFQILSLSLFSRSLNMMYFGGLFLVSPCLGFTQLLDFLHPCVFIKSGKFSAFLSLSLSFFFFWGFTQSFYITVKGGYVQVVLPFLIRLACNADVVVRAAAIKLCPMGKGQKNGRKIYPDINGLLDQY